MHSWSYKAKAICKIQEMPNVSLQIINQPQLFLQNIFCTQTITQVDYYIKKILDNLISLDSATSIMLSQVATSQGLLLTQEVCDLCGSLTPSSRPQHCLLSQNILQPQ